MNSIEAKEFAQELLGAYQLAGWTAELDRAVRRFGRCNYRKKQITLSRRLVELNNQAEVLDTILHEIAHALTGPGVGHGPKWKRIARSIGCSAERCYSPETTVEPPAPYCLMCKKCGRVVTRVWFPSLPMACLSCCRRLSRGQFDKRFLMILRPRKIGEGL